MDRLDLPKEIKDRFPEAVARLVNEARAVADEKRQPIVLVGGVVRDILLDRPVFDADVMVEAPAEPFVKELAKRVKGDVTSHERFMTFTIHIQGAKLDVVTAREERYPAPGALPTVVASTIEKDMKRRDFTVNAMAAYLNAFRQGDMVDPFNGRADLSRRLIRFLHGSSFVDDPTRLFRAARFGARFDFEMEGETQAAIEEAVRQRLPAILSPVRRRHEFELILRESDPIPALERLEAWKALPFIHEAWTIRPEHRTTLAAAGAELPYLERLPVRLAAWFRPYGPDAAKKMMDDLAFEKAAKKSVAASLGGA